MPRRSKKNLAPLIQFPEGIISVYTRITGPEAKRTIKLALATGAGNGRPRWILFTRIGPTR